jgi:uncharacterized membrane protein (UPF0182 family)
MQIEARIDQDPVISEQITLWSQKGSSVIRGNLLVIPMGNSVLYVEPLFLQAQQSQLPELTRVIATYGTHIAMEPSLEAALLQLVRRSAGSAAALEVAQEIGLGETGAPPAAEEAEAEAPAGPRAGGLVAEARSAYDRAVAAQRAGDWAAYGEALDELGRILEELSE